MPNNIERQAKQYSSKDFLRQNHNIIAVINEIVILHKSFNINKFELLSRTGYKNVRKKMHKKLQAVFDNAGLNVAASKKERKG